MLRFALLVLLLANAGYFAWTHGWMTSLGWAPQVQSESYRLKQQVRPDVLRVQTQQPAAKSPEPVTTAATTPPAAPTTTAAESANTITAEMPPVDNTAATSTEPPLITAAATAAAVSAPAAPEKPSEPAICLQAGSFDEAQATKLRTALNKLDLPATLWTLDPIAITGRWMVYLGKFPNEVAMEKRRAELRARKISFDRAGGAWEPGLSLGRFSTEEAAGRELIQMLNQNVRGARVVQERTAHSVYVLRFAALTATQRASLKPAHPAFAGKPLKPCED